MVLGAGAFQSSILSGASAVVVGETTQAQCWCLGRREDLRPTVSDTLCDFPCVDRSIHLDSTDMSCSYTRRTQWPQSRPRAPLQLETFHRSREPRALQTIGTQWRPHLHVRILGCQNACIIAGACEERRVKQQKRRNMYVNIQDIPRARLDCLHVAFDTDPTSPQISKRLECRGHPLHSPLVISQTLSSLDAVSCMACILHRGPCMPRPS